ncbi:MAG: tetratricopeptide repeat protein [Rubrivivax sp.]|nr:tetratricopeptide repeat protein [Pyrinomonadaceae bacterium]
MPKTFTLVTRTLVTFLAFAALGFASLATTTATVSPQNANTPKPPKKKLTGGSNFAQYAVRDASNRLIAGGATRAVGDESLAVNAKAHEAYDAAKYDEAIAGFKRLTELKPTSALAFYHLGVSYETVGKNKEAIEAYRKAAAILGKSDMNDDTKAVKAMSYYNMANALTADNQPTEAIEAYKQVVTLMPGEAVIYNNLGLAYAASDQATEAVESFKKAISVNPEYVEAHFNLGLAYHDLEDKAGAQAQIKALEDLKTPEATEKATQLKGLKN